jgi:tellurite resistance protein
MFADINPMMWPVKYWADWIKQNRKPVKGENVFLDWEKNWSDSIIKSLNDYRDYRDHYLGTTFRLLYENSWMKELFPESKVPIEKETETVDLMEERIRNEMWQQTAEEGGFEAAVVRIILAVSEADKSVDQREYIAAQNAIAGSERLSQLGNAKLKRLVKQQAAIIDHDKQGALEALPKLLTRKADREKAFGIACSIAEADLEIDEKEQKILDQIKSILKL